MSESAVPAVFLPSFAPVPGTSPTVPNITPPPAPAAVATLSVHDALRSFSIRTFLALPNLPLKISFTASIEVFLFLQM